MRSLANAGYTFVAEKAQILKDRQKHSIQKFVIEEGGVE